MGPCTYTHNGGSRYYVVLIDDFTRYTWTSFRIFLYLFCFYCYDKAHFEKSVKYFRSDSGDEYMSTKFHELLASEGTIHQTSCPHTPEQNDIVERKQRHLIETTRFLLSSSVTVSFMGWNTFDCNLFN